MKRNYSMPTPPRAVVIHGSDSWLIFEEDWEYRVRNSVFPFVIWLRTPTPELRALVLAKMATFPPAERREEWLCEKPETLA
jgi:hypothetical protein